LRTGTVHAAAINAMPEFFLSTADLGIKHNWIGSSEQLPQGDLYLSTDRLMSQNPAQQGAGGWYSFTTRARIRVLLRRDRASSAWREA